MKGYIEKWTGAFRTIKNFKIDTPSTVLTLRKYLPDTKVVAAFMYRERVFFLLGKISKNIAVPLQLHLES